MERREWEAPYSQRAFGDQITRSTICLTTNIDILSYKVTSAVNDMNVMRDKVIKDDPKNSPISLRQVTVV